MVPGFHVLQAGYPHSNIILGQHLSIFVVGGMCPGDLFAKADAIDHDVFAEIKQFRKYAGRTGGDSDAIEALGFDICFYRIQGVIRTKDFMRFA